MTRSLIFAALLAALPHVVTAQGAQVSFGSATHDRGAQVEVTADALSINQSDGTAVYSGNVLISQDTMRLTAERVLVVYVAGAGRIDRLEASGGVTIVRGEEAAEARNAIYSIDSGTVTLTGDVLVTQGPSAIAAERMDIDLDTGTAQMSGRVRTVLQTTTEDE